MQPEYKITEKQLNILDDIIAELEQDKTLSLPCKFISYILSEVRDQPLEDKENTEKQENEPQKQKKKRFALRSTTAPPIPQRLTSSTF